MRQHHAECIITGVVIIPDACEQIGYPADLFVMGDVYIVNANMKSGMPVEPTHRTITMVGDYWERNGVHVVHKSQAVLNPAATAYIQGTY
jgi:hypothetical protein